MTIIKIVLCILLALSVGCAKKIDFEFYDSMGRKYTVKTLNASFKKHYGQSYKPYLMLIETPNSNNEEFKKQILVLNSINGEAVNSIFIIANQSKVDTSGYHVMLEMAKKMSNGYDGFRIRILENTGRVILESSHNIKRDRILKIINSR